MPTGYTADVQSGKVTDLRTFALRCARGMGACIMQRDDPMDVLPAPETPTDFYVKRLAELRTDWDTVTGWTDDDAEAAARADFSERHEAWARREVDNMEMKSRYEKMAREVEAWTPPTPDHDGMKKFMAEQLSESIKCDCYETDEPEPKDGPSFKRLRTVQLARKIASYEKHGAEDAGRVASRNAWIAALYEALPKSAE